MASNQTAVEESSKVLTINCQMSLLAVSVKLGVKELHAVWGPYH